MLCDKDGRQIITGDEAARRFGITASYIRKLSSSGELHRVVESERRVFYYVDEVERLTKQKAKARKKRGGRPRKDQTAA